MNAKRVAPIILLAGLLGFPMASSAYDIDIYSGLNAGTTIPNIMVVVDNPSSQNNAVANCTYWDGTAPSNNGQALGADQCALVNLTHSLSKRADGTALLALGFTTMSGVDFPLTPVDDNAYTGTTPVTVAGNAVTIPAGTTNRQAIILAVKALSQTTGKSGQGAEFQETWAYYTGGNGSTYNSINTAKGLLSGRSYPTAAFPATTATTACQKNYIIYLSNVKAGASHAQTWTTSELNPLDAAAYNALKLGNYGSNTNPATNTTFLKIDPLAAGYNGTIAYPTQEAPYGLEWARFMYNTDANTGSVGIQNIVTYSVATGSTTPTMTDSMEQYIFLVAKYGGGKYFAAGSDPAALQNDILQIFNEVQAVNSVFSSSSLPVSVNAQGTFLNQIYMGMFRPDAGGNPRWAGNLKQYQFIYSTANGLQLGDSLGLPAISSGGTGFISANAISFWTCTNTTAPYANTYLANILTSAQVTQLTQDNQNCADPLPNGFWANFPDSVSAAALGYDLPDGERVDRGGAAQQIRTAHMTDSYPNGNTRRVYTFCPSGTGCIANLTDASNAFITTNTAITASMFGASSSMYVASGGMYRCITLLPGCPAIDGTIAVVNTSTANGYATGNAVTITGSNQPEYNVTKSITVTSATQFYMTGFPSTPSSPSLGTYTVGLHNATTYAISGITRSSGATTGSASSCTSGTIPNLNCEIATVTTSTTHPFATGSTVNITGVSDSIYNGSPTITSTGLLTFTYPVPIYPTATAVNGYTVVEHPASVSISGIAKSGNVSVVTTSASHGFHLGESVTISSTSNAGYNATWTITAVTSTTFTINPSGSNPGSSTGGSVAPSTAGIAITSLSRSATTNPATATATGITAGAFANGDHVDITTTGTAANESAYVLSNVIITCTTTPAGTIGNPCTGTTFTYPITVTPTISASGGQAFAPLGTPLSIPAGSITLSYPAGVPTATVAGVTASTFTNGNVVDILASGTIYANESAYTGTWTIACSGTCTSFTISPVTIFPATPATGTIKAYQGSTPPVKDPLINWVRGDDNVGDENSLCPPSTPGGANGTAGVGNCPNPVTTMRPSAHGDVLHSRPTVLNYGYHSIAITGTSDSGTTRTATASATDVTTIQTAGGASPVVSFANGDACVATITSPTTFTYPTTLCGMSGAQTAAVGSKVVVYYGDNGGYIHAINGNRSESIGTAGPGDEIWGFIPSEFFPKLNRLYANSPAVAMPSSPPGITPAPLAKDWFADGAPGIYQAIDGNGNTVAANIYLSMRRGGNFIYALNVSDPTTPKVLWKVDFTGLTTPSGFTASTDYQELGQTWSQPKVTRVAGYCNTAAAATPAPCSAANPPSPVLIFGAGYDNNEDAEPITTMDATGRGIFVLDALTGTLVWSATHSAGATSYAGTTTKATALIAGMNYSFPSDVTLVDRDGDGYIDRLYAADAGGNIWRVDLEPTAGNTPDRWRVYQFAALGGFTGPCGTTPCNPTQRKFFYPPEVITATSKYNFDAVIAGSGDREHPLYVSTTSQRYNRLFMLKDTATGNDASGTTTYPISLAGTNPLDDCTGGTCTLPGGTSTGASWCNLSIPNQNNGYYITLGAGEKVINAPLVAAGYAYMSTNQPAPPNAASCNVNLGTAYGYQLSPFCGTIYRNMFNGGGLPPSPVAGVVDIAVNGVIQHMPFLIGGVNPKCVGSDCSSALGGQKPPINVPTTRQRTYWYIQGK